jgi:acetyltransferase-like isoleucine patch superfamily enzyme
MNIPLTEALIQRLREWGVSTLLRPGATLPQECVFEPPCSLKWMAVQHSLRLGAFSYGVSGFYLGCRIGRYCSFGEQVQIGRHGHPMKWVSTSPFFYLPFRTVIDLDLPPGVELTPQRDFGHTTPSVVARTTTIGNDVWIGHGAFVLPGVKVGDGAAIAAHAVVTKDVPPYALVAGSPAKVVKFRHTEARIEALLKSRWWEYAPWQLKNAEMDDIDAFVEHIRALRAAGTPAYAPEPVKLALAVQSLDEEARKAEDKVQPPAVRPR